MRNECFFPADYSIGVRAGSVSVGGWEYTDTFSLKLPASLESSLVCTALADFL